MMFLINITSPNRYTIIIEDDDKNYRKVSIFIEDSSADTSHFSKSERDGPIIDHYHLRKSITD